MKNFIGIMDCDSGMFVSLDDNDKFLLTEDIHKALTFKTIDKAKEFAKLMLDDVTCYDIVGVNVIINTEQLETINY